jgi:hypothetical protein
LRHAGDGLHHGLCRLQRCLHRAWSARTRLAALVPLGWTAQILRAHLHRAGDTLCARQNARLDMEGLHRPACRGGDNAGSNARINGEAAAMIAMLEAYGAIDDDRPPENDNGALWR